MNPTFTVISSSGEKIATTSRYRLRGIVMRLSSGRRQAIVVGPHGGLHMAASNGRIVERRELALWPYETRQQWLKIAERAA